MIPTALTDDELRFLTDLARHRVVYEAGALLGASTTALARDARLVVSVDPHDGYPRHAPVPTWHRYLENIAPLRHKIQPVRAKFQDAPPTAAYELAWADLTGQAGITEDFLLATEHIRLVAVHDYGRTGCEGETAVVDRWLRTRTQRLRWMTVGTIMLMQRET